jgi:hypothetical protein
MRVQAPSPQERYVINSMVLMTGYYQNQLLTMFSGQTAAEKVVLSTGDSLYWIGQIVGYYHRVEIPQIREVISDAARFEGLRLRWHKERGATSSITQMATCPSYQRIVGMGDRAIPLMLRELDNHEDDPDHWFWALQAITDNDPVPPDHRGDMKAMARDWLEWGYMSGYDW